MYSALYTGEVSARAFSKRRQLAYHLSICVIGICSPLGVAMFGKCQVYVNGRHRAETALANEGLPA